MQHWQFILIGFMFGCVISWLYINHKSTIIKCNMWMRKDGVEYYKRFNTSNHINHAFASCSFEPKRDDDMKVEIIIRRN